MIFRLLKDSSIYGLFSVISTFTGILLTPVFTRVFAPAEYATLDLLLVTSMLLAIISGMRIESGVARDYFLAPDDQHERLLAAVGFNLATVSQVIWIVVFALGFALWFNGIAGITWVYFLPVVLTLFPRRIYIYALELIRLQSRPRTFVAIAGGQTLTSALLAIAAVTIFGFGIAGVLWAFFISWTVYAVIAAIMIRRDMMFVWNATLAKSFLAYGIPLVPAYLSQWVQQYSTRILLIVTIGLTSAGYFTLALKIAAIASMAVLAFNQAWIPAYNQLLDKSDNSRQYPRVLNLYLAGMLALAGATTAFAWPLVLIFATPLYLPAVPIVGFLIMAIIWDGGLKIIDAGISKTRQTYWVTVAIMVGWIVNLLSFWLLVDRLQASAGGVAYFLGIVTTFSFVWVVAQRLHYFPYHTAFILFVMFTSAGLAMWNYATFFASPASSMSDMWTQVLLNAIPGFIMSCVAILIVLRSENLQVVFSTIQNRLQR